MTAEEKARWLVVFACAVLLLAMAIGWVLNIVDIVHMATEWNRSSNWALFLLRCMGVIVFPVGGFLGYI